MTAHPSTTAFTCPKCHGAMRSYERSGIVLEQCEDCRGIFLDQGELERFVEAEGGGWSGRVGPPRPEWAPVSAGPGGDRQRERDSGRDVAPERSRARIVTLADASAAGASRGRRRAG